MKPNQMDYECAVIDASRFIAYRLPRIVRTSTTSMCFLFRFTLWLMVQLVLSPKTACAPQAVTEVATSSCGARLG
jgi:hypothetical protein